MRILFLFLVVLNILFFGWQTLRPQQLVVTIASLASNLSDITLLREQLAVNSVSAEKVTGSIGLVHEAVSCHTLGPFEDNQPIDELKAELKQLTTQLKPRVIEESQLHRYWVYLKAANHEEAVVTTKLLILQNITDYFIMAAGSEKRVSLGHFKEKTYADRRAQQIKQLGFAAETDVVYHHFKLYWLDYALVPSQRDRVAGLIAPYLQNEISILNRECEKIVD